MPALRDNQMVALRSLYGGTKALEDYLTTFTTDNPTFAGIGRYGFYTTALTAMGVSYPTGAALNDLAQTYWGIRASTPYSVSGLVGWWDASNTTYITSVAGAVSKWGDISGSGNNVTQSTTSKKPTTGSATINSLNVLTFLRSSDQWLAKSGVTTAQPFTFFIVYKRSGVGGNFQILGNSTNPEPTMYTSSDIWNLYDGSNIASSVSSDDTRTHYATVVFNTASTNMWLDAVQIITNGTLTGNSRTDISLGSDQASAALDGNIAEVLIYSGALSAGNRATIEAYLRTKWGLHAFVPTDVTGLVGWWDASVAASITSSGGAVSQWADQSTSGFNLTATTTAQPATGTNTQNSLNVLTFDGSSDILRNLTTSVTATNTGTWIAVLKPSSTAPTNNGRILTMQKNGETEWLEASSISAMNRNGTNAGVSMFYSGSEKAVVSVTNDAAHVVVTQRNGDTTSSWRDGTAGAVTTGLGTSNFGFNFISVGGEMATDGTINAGSFWKGDVAEILWYNAAISTSDRIMIQNYLKAKWATP